MTYAVVRMWGTTHPRSSGDNYVVEWPYTWRNHHIELLAGPFDTLAEAQAAAATSIPSSWPAYEIWSEPAA